MIFKLACGDIMPGCAAHFESGDRDDLIGRVARHAASAHGVTDISPAFLANVSSKIAVAA